MGSRAVLNAVVKRKITAFAGTRTSEHTARSPALYYRAIPETRNVNVIIITRTVPASRNS